MNTKTCKDCGVEYPKTTEFFNRNTNKKYLKPCCKDCEKIRNRKYRKDNKEKITEQRREYRLNSKENIAEYNRKYRKDNKEKIAEQRREYRSLPEYRQKRSEYRSLPEVKKRRNEQLKKKRDKDPDFKLRNNVSCLVRSYLFKGDGGKDNSVWDALPYAPQELREHIESQFEDWMTWENYGNGEGFWNIDHIIPQSKLLYDSLEHPNFQKCWALENLQPLCSIENSSKGNRTN